jgi:hypothetical protein
MPVTLEEVCARCAAYVNAATTPEDRVRRKAVIFGLVNTSKPQKGRDARNSRRTQRR